ncbi:MAG: sigma-70 family RNA polymerase sigma factor [Capsulimonas sp.]|uniref:RNA polymerase sigma factor n=1 Tax=Capsulimonas sp. TaxID=2494211 RepID=UPI0032670D56
MAQAPRARWKTKADGDVQQVSGPEEGLRGAAEALETKRAQNELLHDFDALVERYNKPLFNVIYQWIGDYDEAADLTQETFVSAYKAREQFRGDAQVYTWLYRIAHNHCKNRFKQRDRARQAEGPSLDAGVSGDGDDMVSETREIADWSFSPSRVLEQKELRALVQRAVDSLASEYKVVLVLREMEGMSYNEIADVTGLTMEAVKTRLNRARGMVRQRVEPYYKT